MHFFEKTPFRTPLLLETLSWCAMAPNRRGHGSPKRVFKGLLGVFGGFLGGSWGSRVAPGPPWNPPKCRDCVWRRPRASREPLGRLLGATGGVAKASREPPWSLPGDSQEPLGRRKSLTGASLEPPQGLSRAFWESPAVFKTCPHPPMARECQLSYRNKAEPTCKRGSLVDQRPVLLAEDVEKRGRRNGRSPHESPEFEPG